MADKKTSDEWLEKLWNQGESKSLLRKHCTKETVKDCKYLKTKLGGTIKECIMSGALHANSGVGLYACDPEAYTTFAPVFAPLIKEYHKIPADKEVKNPPSDFGNIGEIPELEPHLAALVVSTRVRVGRSVKGYGFPPTTTKAQRVELEDKFKAALSDMPEGLNGKYFPMDGMSEADRQNLVDSHFLFKDDDPMLRDAGGYDDWPVGRGIFHNKDKTFLVWSNEEDHLRIISMEAGADFRKVFKRLKDATDVMQKKFDFATHPQYGNLTYCPTNLGTGMRASIHAKFPLLCQVPCFKQLANSLGLDVRGIHGEHTESVGGVHDISNKFRLGYTEFELMNMMVKGCQILLEMEYCLQKWGANPELGK